jgi:hypothetical protein
MLPPSISTLKMEARDSSKTVVYIYQSTWCRIPEDYYEHSVAKHNKNTIFSPPTPLFPKNWTDTDPEH